MRGRVNGGAVWEKIVADLFSVFVLSLKQKWPLLELFKMDAKVLNSQLIFLSLFSPCKLT